MTTRWIHDERGSSLLEVMITLVLLAIVLPPLIQLYSSAMLDASVAQTESIAIRMCQQKMEDIETDKASPARGFSWVTTSGRYASETISSFTRTVQIDTAGKFFSGVSYAEVTVLVVHTAIPAVTIKTWLTRY